jgi:Xaa-Pro aminopeptidase
MKRGNSIKFLTIFAAAVLFFSLSLALQSQDTNIFKQRRQKLAEMVEEGIVIIQSSERNQNNLYEFFVENSDNHDFIYFTGLETPKATLILCPGSEEFPEILYIDGDREKIREKTGIAHIFPEEALFPDLSSAFSDFSQLRFTQRRFKPLPSEISRILYNNGGKKIIYFNYPRFVNLDEPPPIRLEFIHKFVYFSPKYEIRDASDLIDQLRIVKDTYEIELLRKATQISGEAMIECMRSAVPGMTEEQLRAVYNFTCHFKGAKSFGFPTTVRSGPRGYAEHFPRGTKVLNAGELITIDAGAEIEHYTADIQRTFPVSGTFTEEQKNVYNILKKAQEACIRLVKPGVTMKELQDKAIEVLDAEGGYGKYFRWGTSHFLGMEVHDYGNNLIPFKPGIFITVEPGVILDNFSVVLEDDVLCTKDGYDWFTEFIPREVEDIERIMKEKGIGEICRSIHTAANR